MKEDFLSVYKELRNRWRVYRPESIVSMAMRLLQQKANDKLEDLRRAPWHALLLVKWVLQDEMASDRTGHNITPPEFDDLRQRLHDFPERIAFRDEHSSMRVFFRQLIYQQAAFQRRVSSGFVREAALLGNLGHGHALPVLFREKTGMDVLEFADLALSTYVKILNEECSFESDWFGPLRASYGDTCVDAFIAAISRTYEELTVFCRTLPDAKRHLTSELYEFPLIKRFPFLLSGKTLRCWHPMVFYRGMESFVHSVMSEARGDFIERFSKVFETHVVGEVERTGLGYFNEKQLRTFVDGDLQIPDALISFAAANVLVESKAGLFDESVMVVGQSEILAIKTRALRKAIEQGWSASLGIRDSRRAPAQVLSAPIDYLLVVTNKELGASRGTTLRDMYPAGKLDYPNANAEKYLPLERVYVLSIEDFERLMRAASERSFDLPAFLDYCVKADEDPVTAVYYFEQHLDTKKVPRQVSSIVKAALEASQHRLEGALGNMN